MTTIEKTFSFKADAEFANRQAAASKAMTPEQRAAAFLVRMSDPRMIRQGRVF